MKMRPRGCGALAPLAADDAGVSIIEFALLAPVFLMMLVGMLDVGQTVYAQSLLNGAVEAAARDTSLEGGDADAADDMVLDAIGPIMPGVTLTTSRRSYYDFADIERAERWNDANDDGTCADGEAFTDENRNGEWDEDIGISGNGGANDVVIYSVVASYDPIFKVPFLPELWATRTLESSAVRKNQPFADQSEYSASAGTCS